MKKKIITGLAALTVLTFFAACAQTDVIAKYAPTTFEAVLDKIPDKISSDESLNGWVLTSPAGDRFIWSKDFAGEGTPDVMMEFDAKPFIDAGLDPDKFTQGTVMGDKLIYRFELGSEKFGYEGEPTPIASFKEIVRTNRDLIGYHKALDHYGISLGLGNMFEWARDTEKNDKDIVFVLDPKPFVEAGAKVDAIEGWTFAKVEMMKGGKTEMAEKLLRTFDLK